LTFLPEKAMCSFNYWERSRHKAYDIKGGEVKPTELGKRAFVWTEKTKKRGDPFSRRRGHR